MSKFVKKPVVIEATQWFKDGDHEKVLPSTVERDRRGTITTLEGNLIVSPGDWIITGVEGEVYPCKPEIFKKTYEPADVASIQVKIDAAYPGDERE